MLVIFLLVQAADFFLWQEWVLTGINWLRLHSDRRMWVLLADISLRLEMWFCGDDVERFG